MRIGLIAPPWLPVPPIGYGGTELVVDGLARGLAAAGHDVLLAASGDSTCPVPMVAGLPAAQSDRIGETVIELSHLAMAYDAMGDMDVVHDHTFAGALYRHRPRGVPVVATNHGPFDQEFLHVFQAMQRDTSIIALSRHQAATAHGVRIRRVIPHGIDVQKVPMGDGRGGYACFLGRMSPHKGAREAALVARRAGVPLLLAAKMREPLEREYFDAEVAPLLGGDIEYVGELGDRDKFALLGEALALVNPIQWPEPFGLVMIEALAAGTPVLARPEGAAPEIVQDSRTGFLRDDTDALAKALLDVGDLDRTHCRQQAEQRFSTSRMVGDHLGLYQDVVSEPQRS